MNRAALSQNTLGALVFLGFAACQSSVPQTPPKKNVTKAPVSKAAQKSDDTKSQKVVRYEVLNVAMGGHEVGTIEIKDIILPNKNLKHVRKSDLSIKRGELTLKLRSETNTLTSPLGKPLSYTHEQSGASGDAKSEGKVSNNVLHIKTVQAGATVEKSIPMAGILFATTAEYEARGNTEAGKSVRKVFVEELGAVVDMGIEIKPTKIGRDVTTSFKTLETTERLNKEGAILISRTPALGSIAYPRGTPPPKEVKAGAVDVLAKSVWPAPAIDKASKVVRYRVKTPDAARFYVPEDQRQRVIARNDTFVDVEVKQGVSDSTTLSADALKEYLVETAFEPVNDARIKSAAQKAIKGKSKLADKISALVNFVFNHVDDKALDRGYAAAPLTLESKRGDCTEHSVLLSALLRSQGIPTRLVDGVVLTGTHVGYHEWVEVYVEGVGFVPADPTFGEYPATPLRLKLAEGSSSPEGLLELGVAAGRLLRPGVEVSVLSHN